MIPAGLDPRSFLGAGSMSYSEINTLSNCESKWHLTYGQPDRERTAPSPAMALGTEIHRMWGDWWLTGSFESEDPTALWVMNRYAEMYGADRATGRMRMIEHERPFALPLPDGTYAFGWVDGLIEVSGMTDPTIGPLDGLWVDELKTSGNISNLIHLTCSPQMPLYVLALLIEGLPIRGALLDVACTSGGDKMETKADAYKRFRALGMTTRDAKAASADVTQRLTLEPTPVAESFERRWLAFDEAKLAGVVGTLGATAMVRNDLLTGVRVPLKNVGPFNCKSCPVLAECHGLDVTILDDDPAVEAD